MTKHTRFRFFTVALIWFVILFFALGFTQNIIDQYLSQYDEYIRPVYWIITTFRTISVLGIIGIGLYFTYTSVIYMSSRFYKESGIPLHEAYFHGYFDLAYAYERLKNYGHDTTYDTKTRSIICKYDHATFYIIVRDIFGRLDGDPKSDTWYIVSKKRKQYGNTRYMKRKPLKNPIVENQMYINQVQKQEGVEMKNYVVLTGIRQNTFQHEQINTVYEMAGILQHQYLEKKSPM
jgi:hypothetical protein